MYIVLAAWGLGCASCSVGENGRRKRRRGSFNGQAITLLKYGEILIVVNAALLPVPVETLQTRDSTF